MLGECAVRNVVLSDFLVVLEIELDVHPSKIVIVLGPRNMSVRVGTADQNTLSLRTFLRDRQSLG